MANKFLDEAGVTRLWAHVKQLVNNAITSIEEATTSKAGLMSASDKTKLNGLKNYSVATTTANGLMSSADKLKLNGMSFSFYDNCFDFTSIETQFGYVAKNQAWGYYRMGDNYYDMDDLPDGASVSVDTVVLFSKADGVFIAYLYAKNGTFVQEYELNGGFTPESPAVPLKGTGWRRYDTGLSVVKKTFSFTIPPANGIKVTESPNLRLYTANHNITLDGDASGKVPQMATLDAMSVNYSGVAFCPSLEMISVTASGNSYKATLRFSFIARDIDPSTPQMNLSGQVSFLVE